MRTARLVGLSPDGKSLIVATESGEEFMIEADERLRAALRGDRPRLGQLEIEMESSLTPRDIQARIRAGETLEDVARVAGIPMDRVERFAAPVLAEREHVASMAMASEREPAEGTLRSPRSPSRAALKPETSVPAAVSARCSPMASIGKLSQQGLTFLDVAGDTRGRKAGGSTAVGR